MSLDFSPDDDTVDALSSLRHKKRLCLPFHSLSEMKKVVVNGFYGLLANGHEALLVPLPDDSDKVVIHVIDI